MIPFPGELMKVMAVLTAIIHVVCMFRLWSEANRYQAEQSAQLLMLPKAIWILSALIGGVIVVCFFWVIHWSTLNPRIRL